MEKSCDIGGGEIVLECQRDDKVDVNLILGKGEDQRKRERTLGVMSETEVEEGVKLKF